jgi:AraC-like DNA-binding protein
MGSFAFEKHYRVKDLAGLWGLSAKTVARIFADEAGVIRVPMMELASASMRRFQSQRA